MNQLGENSAIYLYNLWDNGNKMLKYKTATIKKNKSITLKLTISWIYPEMFTQITQRITC